MTPWIKKYKWLFRVLATYIITILIGLAFSWSFDEITDLILILSFGWSIFFLAKD